MACRSHCNVFLLFDLWKYMECDYEVMRLVLLSGWWNWVPSQESAVLLESNILTIQWLANKAQSSTHSHPFYPGPSHAVEFQKCLIALFNSKPVFINLFHSFIYFHREFVIALSKPFDKFLFHSSPCTAIFTDDEVKTIDPLNASPSTTFLCHHGYKLLPSTHYL